MHFWSALPPPPFCTLQCFEIDCGPWSQIGFSNFWVYVSVAGQDAHAKQSFSKEFGQQSHLDLEIRGLQVSFMLSTYVLISFCGSLGLSCRPGPLNGTYQEATIVFSSLEETGKIAT